MKVSHYNIYLLELVPKGGLEPPRVAPYALKRTCLPVPPLRLSKKTVDLQNRSDCFAEVLRLDHLLALPDFAPAALFAAASEACFLMFSFAAAADAGGGTVAGCSTPGGGGAV